MLRIGLLADSHLDAFSNYPELNELAWSRFSTALRHAAGSAYEFVAILGDITHSAAPGPGVLTRLVKTIRSTAARVVLLSGSHDSGTGQDSYLKLLDAAGVVTLLDDAPRVIECGSVSVGVAALSGQRGGTEVLQKTRSAKTIEWPGGVDTTMFFYHTAIREALPDHLRDKVPSVPVNKLPGGFSVYAGGHLHWPYALSRKGKPVLGPGVLLGASLSEVFAAAKAQMLELTLDSTKSRWSYKTVGLPGRSVFVLNVTLPETAATPDQSLAYLKHKLAKLKRAPYDCLAVVRVAGYWPDAHLAVSSVRAVLPKDAATGSVIVDTSRVRRARQTPEPARLPNGATLDKRIASLADDTVDAPQANAVFGALSVLPEPDEAKGRYQADRVAAGVKALAAGGSR